MSEKPTLRPYQVQSVESAFAEWGKGVRRTLLVLATGLGKTVVAAEVILRFLASGGRALFLAHREELLEQTLAKLADAGVQAELEQASHRASLSALVVVASVQTLQRARLARFPATHFGLIVVDEAHHAPATTYRNVLGHFALALVLGLTATPKRADGKGLDAVFQTVCFQLSMREGIALKFLAPLVVQRVRLKSLDLRAVKKTAGDFNQSELDALMGQERVLHETLAPLVELMGERRTILFSVSVAHAHAMAQLLEKRYGRSAIAVDGSAHKDHRRAVLRAFKRGEHQVLVNCALFTEGFDEPSIECVAVARPTMSAGLMTQMIGRGTRLSPETGKASCLALDFVGASRFGLASPLDALAGDGVPDDVRDAVESLLAKGKTEDLSKLLEETETTVAASAKSVAIIAEAAYCAAQINPFLGEHMGPAAHGGGPLTPEVLVQLAKYLGMKKPPPHLTLNEAQRWIKGAKKRLAAGLCSYPQARTLERALIDPKLIARMSFARATELCGLLSVYNPPWHPDALRGQPERRGSIR